jgi:hypothetical protein
MFLLQLLLLLVKRLHMLIYRTSNLVDLFRSLQEDIRFTQQVAFNPLTDSTVRKVAADADTDEDMALNFQERSLRGFFRQPGRMKMEPHTAQLKIFLTCIDVLCGSDNDSEPKSLQVYAVTGRLKPYLTSTPRPLLRQKWSLWLKLWLDFLPTQITWHRLSRGRTLRPLSCIMLSDPY